MDSLVIRMRGSEKTGNRHNVGEVLCDEAGNTWHHGRFERAGPEGPAYRITLAALASWRFKQKCSCGRVEEYGRFRVVCSDTDSRRKCGSDS